MFRPPKYPRLELEEISEDGFGTEYLLIEENPPFVEQEIEIEAESSSSYPTIFASFFSLVDDTMKDEEEEELEELDKVEVLEEEVVEELEDQEVVEVAEEQELEEEEEDGEGPSSSVLPWPNNTRRNNLSCTLWSNIYGSNDPEDESPLIFPPPIESEDLAPEPLGDQITELVHTLIFKHGIKEPITKEEMVELVTKEYEELLPTILEKATSCLEVIFGIDVKEMDSNTYVLVNSLGLTFEDKLNDAQTMPRNGLLIMLLGVIFLEENCAPEEKVWAFLNMVGVYAGQEHFIYGEPRKFITIDLVQENYVEYRRVLYSDPPRFEFLWGPRALAETTKMKVLEFMAKAKGTDIFSFSDWYEEALRDEHNDHFESDHADGNNPLFVTDHLESMPLGSYEDAEFELPLFDFEVGSAYFQ
ncbi:PREDICTED: melanoma-associated antigen 8-like [Dipodomys ordii]|uniref:Melanoma-associated antigen 8-like n=1 Tax=Dipodomys ordii TaxID=10020 RepID=A0A1S3FXU9_DIPOR|nr:PREDICTED: melanoma-associated antigen 8-like [Dipodomys ordii]